jgi:hypothetical protein
VHTLGLEGNQISPDTQELLRQQHPHIAWKF